MLAQFLSEVNHQGTGIDEGRDNHSRQGFTTVATDEVGGQSLLIVVLHKMKHVRTEITKTLPTTGNGRSTGLPLENSYKLKNMLVEKGCVFVSDTDTEVVAQLIGDLYRGDPLTAISDAMRLLEGSFALAILFRDDPYRIYCVCKDSPMVVGYGRDGAHIASDIPAMLAYTRDVTFMGDKQIAVLSPEGIAFYRNELLGYPAGAVH